MNKLTVTVDDLFVGAGRPVQQIQLGRRLNIALRTITFAEMLRVQDACASGATTANGFMVNYLAASIVEATGHKFNDPYEAGEWHEEAHTANCARILSMPEAVASQLFSRLTQHAVAVQRLLWNSREVTEKDGKTRPATEDDHLTEVAGRCSPLSEDELYATGRVKQHVPILPDKLEVVFQNLSTQESLHVEAAGRGLYVLGRGVARRLACALVSLNGVLYDPHFMDGVFSEEKVEAKVNGLLRMPMPVIAELDMQEAAFTRRVNDAFQWEPLGNA